MRCGEQMPTFKTHISGSSVFLLAVLIQVWIGVITVATGLLASQFFSGQFIRNHFGKSAVYIPNHRVTLAVNPVTRNFWQESVVLTLANDTGEQGKGKQHQCFLHLKFFWSTTGGLRITRLGVSVFQS